MRVAVIGGGAAGCFCAVNIKRLHPDWNVSVYEAGPRLMRKLGLTGGGRCNITNSFEYVDDLRSVYPRGFRLMKRLLCSFSAADTVEWFEDAGVRLHTEDGGRVFPDSQKASEVVDCLNGLIRRLGVEVFCGRKIESFEVLSGFDAIVITTGGGLPSLLEGVVPVEKPVSSLFTFKLEGGNIQALAGTSVKDVIVGLAGTKFRACGDLLITDWGVSGPAVLRLSSYAARFLAENSYRGTLLVNWLGLDEQQTRLELLSLLKAGGHKTVGNAHPASLSSRLWAFLLSRAGLRPDIRCEELVARPTRLASVLCCDQYEICGRAAFKDEFVTCGGVALSAVESSTLELKSTPHIYFAGEVLDIDAVTGGFNLQAAWSSAMAVARGIQ